MKNGPGSYGEVVFAIFTDELVPFVKLRDILMLLQRRHATPLGHRRWPFGIGRRWNYVVGYVFLLDVFIWRRRGGGIDYVQRVSVVHRHPIHKRAGEAQVAVNLIQVHAPKLAECPIWPFYSWSGRPLVTVGVPPLQVRPSQTLQSIIGEVNMQPA